MERKSYVYEHWRPDLDVPFWVGKGTGDRARIFKRRNNNHYNSIVAKLIATQLKIEVRFVAVNLTDDEAFNLEIERMEFWKTQDIKLANKSVGGRGGMSGVTRSAESRAKQSATTTGKKLSLEHAAKLVAWLNSPEGKAVISAVHTGRKRPLETGEKISAAQKKLWADPEYKAEMIAAMSVGRPEVASEETRIKMRAAKTPEIKLTLAETVRAKWMEPGERERRSAAMSISNAGRVVSDAARESGRRAMTPERRARSSEELKSRWSDPIKKQEMIASLSAAKTGVSLSLEHVESLKKSWTPERRKLISDKMRKIRAERKDWGKCA